MAFSEFEIARYTKEMDAYIAKHRPPPKIRKQLDIAYRLENQSIEIFEIRPRYNNPKQKVELAVAKFTYVKAYDEWRIYWQKSDFKWYRYDPYESASSLSNALEVVSQDEYSCFWG